MENCANVFLLSIFAFHWFVIIGLFLGIVSFIYFSFLKPKDIVKIFLFRNI